VVRIYNSLFDKRWLGRPALFNLMDSNVLILILLTHRRNLGFPDVMSDFFAVSCSEVLSGVRKNASWILWLFSSIADYSSVRGVRCNVIRVIFSLTPSYLLYFLIRGCVFRSGERGATVTSGGHEAGWGRERFWDRTPLF
jgi:hypothetical protein